MDLLRPLGNAGMCFVPLVIGLMIEHSLSNTLQGRDAEKLHLFAAEQVPLDHEAVVLPVL